MKSSYEQFFKNAKANSQKVNSDFVKKKKPISPKMWRPDSDIPPIGGKPPNVEKVLRQALSVSKKKKKSIRGSMRDMIPLALLSGGGVIASIWLFFQPHGLEQIFDQVEIRLLGQLSASEAKKSEGTAEKSSGEKSTTSIQEKEAKSSSSEGPANPVTNEAVPQDLSYFAKLNDKRRELDLREKELDELEEELHKQKREVEERIQHLEKLRDQIAGVLKDKVDVDQQKVKTLVEFYSNMKPQQAAKVMGTLNEDLAIEVLGQMKKKNAAEIMNLLEPAKAQTISEKFAGYKRR